MLSGAYFYEFNTTKKPGKILCYAVRFELLELDSANLDDTNTFNLLAEHPELRPFRLQTFKKIVAQNLPG